MYKTLAAAALVGAASAAQNVFTPMTFTWANSDNSMVYYTGTVSMTYDAGYTTLYNQGNMMPDSSETYQLNLFAFANLEYQHEAFQAYTGIYDFKLNLLDITPYGQQVQWTRFDNGQGFTVSGAGFRNIQFGTVQTRVRENAKTCMWSAFSGTMPTAPMCSYNQDKWTDYIDPVWGFNLGNYLQSQGTDLSSFYGMANYYTF